MITLVLLPNEIVRRTATPRPGLRDVGAAFSWRR
jgi:hypothetical protein